jgi:hypothetical protein
MMKKMKKWKKKFHKMMKSGRLHKVIKIAF